MREESWSGWRRLALEVRDGTGDGRLRVGSSKGVGDEVVVVEWEFGREGREGEVVDASGGAVLAASAVGVLVVGDVHDG